jgi:hypothetical protein
MQWFTCGEECCIRVASQEGFERAGGRTADPSTSLRFGRDDKGRGVVLVGVVRWMEGPAGSLAAAKADPAFGRRWPLSIRNSGFSKECFAAEETNYFAVQPPSIKMSVPVINPANSEQR